MHMQRHAHSQWHTVFYLCREMHPPRISEFSFSKLAGYLNGKEVQKGGMYVYVWLIDFVVQYNIVKQLYSNKN